MPPDQPRKHSGPSKRRRRSRARSMTELQEVMGHTESSELETSRLRKHDRCEQDSQADGPSKRAKLHRNSEPPTLSRTTSHRELSESSQTLEREDWAAKHAVKNKNQEVRYMEHDFRWGDGVLKRVRKLCDEMSEKVRKQRLTIQTDREKLQALQELCARKDEELKARDGTIGAKQQELDKAKKDLETALQETEAARTINDSNGSWNQSVVRRERRAKETLQKERKDYRKTIKALEEEISELKQQHADLNSKMKTQVGGYMEMITRLQLKVEQSRPQSQRFNFKEPDEKVKQDFQGLESKIRQFVYTYTRTVLDATDQELQMAWPGWSPGLRRFLASPILCNLVFEANVWEYLLARIFAPWSEVWAGRLARPLENVLRVAGVEAGEAGFESELYAHYQYWRSSSSCLIGRMNGEDFQPKHFDPDVKALTSTLANLCGLPEAPDDMKADAVAIFQHARDFEVMLRKLKAPYSFCMGKAVPGGVVLKHGVDFDHKLMVDRSPKPSDKETGRVPAVDFIWTPGLHKRGNNDGDGYNSDTWLVKMGVVCDASRFHRGSDPSTTAWPVAAQTRTTLHPGEVKQDIEGSTASKVKTEPSISGPFLIKYEETYLRQSPDPLSSPGLTSGPPSADATRRRPDAVGHGGECDESQPGFSHAESRQHRPRGSLQHQVNECSSAFHKRSKGQRD